MFFSLSPSLLIHLYNKYWIRLRMEKTFNPNLFVAKWYCSKVGPEDMPAFATDALEAGYDGPSLRQLAGLLKPTSREVDNLFYGALREIETVRIQSKEQAVIALSRVTAADIVEGRIDPLQGAYILERYGRMVGYPEFLAEFLQLSEMPLWGEYAPPRDKLFRDIMEQARLLLANIPE
jgi:hypothetical protein